MIYYKKRSLLRKAFTRTIRKMKEINPPSFRFSRAFFILPFCFILFLYCAYLFIVPSFVDEAKIENAINGFILKNSNLSLDVGNFSLRADYKFDINIKSDYIKLKYPDKSEFMAIDKLSADINLLTFFRGYIDLNKIKTQKITINSKFTKNKEYDCFKCLDGTSFDLNSKFKIRNINLICDELLINLFDENINKKFFGKFNNLKISCAEFKKPLVISSKGKISSQSGKISDIDLNLSIKINQDSLGKFREKLKKFNYNPLRYADEYKFYSRSDINLKITPNDKRPDISGTVALKDYSFELNGMKLPVNNLSLIFGGDKISCDADFKFIKNQYIKIKSTASFSKNKYIEARLFSGEINLQDLNEILIAATKIFNLKLNPNDISLFGLANIDLYLKSNFKTINSSGKLLIKDAKIIHKKTGLVLNKINSNINFANNTINILDTSAFVNDAKFNLKGVIDSCAKLNIKINSDEINIAQVISLVKEMPILRAFAPDLADYSFKSGFLKINSLISGTLEKPQIICDSTLNNLKVYLKKADATLLSDKIILNIKPDISSKASVFGVDIRFKDDVIKAPELNLEVLDNDIIIKNSKATYNKIPVSFEGQLKDYKTDKRELFLQFRADLKNNPYVTIKDNNSIASGNLSVKKDKIILNSLDIINNNLKLISLTGKVVDMSKEPALGDFHILINEKTPIILKTLEKISFSLKGNLTLDGKIKTPNVSGKLNVYDIKSDDLNLNIDDILLIIKNSEFYINIVKGRIFDFDFELASKAKYSQNKLIADYASFHSMYINLENFEKYLKNSKTINKFNYEINNLKGSVLTLETSDILLNSLNFEGSVSNNILDIKNFSAEALNGKISGKTKINLLTQKVNAELILKELNIRLLSNKLKELSIAYSGKLSALINAEFQGFLSDNILSSLNGYIKFNIDNGELAQFAKLERFLQAGNILSQSILKLTLNSTLSALTKQNTGDFKTIEGTVKIKNSTANIQYVKSQGSNMSLYITGEFNLLNQYMRAKILGRIPVSMVNVMGNIGKFSLSDSVEKMDEDTKGVIKSITASPIEKMMSTYIPKADIAKIPPLAYADSSQITREFIVYIDGLIKNISAVQNFKWALREN